VIVRAAIAIVPPRIHISGVIGRRVVIGVVEEGVVVRVVGVIVRVVVVVPVWAPIEEAYGEPEGRVPEVRPSARKAAPIVIIERPIVAG
jgi:hypothetical protein